MKDVQSVMFRTSCSQISLALVVERKVVDSVSIVSNTMSMKFDEGIGGVSIILMTTMMDDGIDNGLGVQ